MGDTDMTIIPVFRLTYFSTSPEKYVSHALRQKIDEAVSEYLAAA